MSAVQQEAAARGRWGMSEPVKCCGTCVWFGKLKFGHKGHRACKIKVGLPKIKRDPAWPDSVIVTQLNRVFMKPSSGVDCPCYESRQP
jgi:hypothetical protein